jgi:CelD/BcsL family acetyltransferase involved in cellulose biosynthesis/RimJ/RimL family protein N-acetyltransferase
VLRYGAEAEDMLASDDFRRAWERLHDNCPWATVFLGIAFAATWYRVYRQKFQPVVVVERNENGLSGLLLLAYAEETRKLVPVGGRDAEYDAWLGLPERGGPFIEEALDLLAERFRGASLTFQYLAAGAPVEWAANGRWARHCELVPVARALRDVGDGASFQESLKKKSNKSRYNRLTRMGSVEFTRVSSSGELASVLDTIAIYSDLRHGAVHNNFPFRVDPLRKKLYTELMRAPHLLHATVLRLSGEVLAGHIGYYNRDQVLLGIITHSPVYGEYSPGKLLMLLLGLELAAEGVPTFDLTPGTLSGYKERFATHHDEVHVLKVWFARRDAWRNRARVAALRAMRSAAESIGVEPGKLRRRIAAFAASAARSLRTLSSPAALRSTLWHEEEIGIHRVDAGPGTASSQVNLRRDDLSALLAFSPIPRELSRQQFLSRALANLEKGWHVYTWSKAERLMYCAWIAPSAEHHLDEIGRSFQLPDRAVMLSSCFTHPELRNAGFYLQALSELLRHATAFPGVQQVYMAIPADDTPLRAAAAKVGFERERSFSKRKRFWRIVTREQGAAVEERGQGL